MSNMRKKETFHGFPSLPFASCIRTGMALINPFRDFCIPLVTKDGTGECVWVQQCDVICGEGEPPSRILELEERAKEEGERNRLRLFPPNSQRHQRKLKACVPDGAE